MRRRADIGTACLNFEASPHQRMAVWLVAVLVAFGLGSLRVATDAEFGFASAVILPVVVVAWLGGYREGMAYAALASLMWVSADLLAERSFSATWIPVLNGLIRFAVYALIAWLIATLRDILLRERRLARHDALTGLLNRRAFFEIGRDEMDRARRYGHAIGIAFLDLDNFKRLNDTQGHEAGDRALKAVAFALTGSLRVTDRVARLGGDEFAVILPEASFAAATDAGNKLSDVINLALQEFPPASVSIGIAWFELAATDFDDMVKAADALMYEIKQDGKQGVRSKRMPTTAPHPHQIGTPMTYQAIFVASAFLLLAFGIERVSSKFGVPAVVALIATGVIGKPMLAAFDLSIAGIDAAVPVLGSVGLVLIVLEGALDIELRRERLRAAAKAFSMAGAGFVVCTATFAFLAAFTLPLSFFQATLLAIPFAVISSAVAIPSSGFLPQSGREFVLYESSVSDILGVMVFFALLNSDGTLPGILNSLAGGGILSLLMAVSCAIGLTLLMLRIEGHIRFIPLLAGMFGLYAAGKLLHLSPLIMILLFGLALNNPTLITRFRPFRNWIDESYPATLREFKLFTVELTFAVRGFFFILLGYWTDLSTLNSLHAWITAIVVLLVIYASRYAILRLARVDLADPLTWLAPRGLITVLLFIATKEAIELPAYIDGTIMLVVLISASLTAVGRVRLDNMAIASPR